MIHRGISPERVTRQRRGLFWLRWLFPDTAAKLAALQHGGDRKSDEIKVQICTPTLQQAADQLDVGRRTVAHAKTVLANGSPS